MTAGTIFQATRTPLPRWFRAMWWVTSQRTGASALGLQHVLGLGSYETAWTWLHKLHRAMVRPGRDRLTGTVQVDALLGGVDEWARGRQTEKKAMIAVAAGERGPEIGLHPAAADPATSVPPSSLSSSRLGTTSSVSPAPTRQPPR